MKRFLLAAFFCVLLLASALNIWGFPRTEVAVNGGNQFNIGQFAEANNFDEVAPIVLANHFSKVHVYRVGSPRAKGVSFSPELAAIFKIKQVSRKSPYDIRGKSAWKQLEPFTKYTTRAACSVSKSHVCKVVLVWDDQNKSPYRDFVTLRISYKTFAIVDSTLTARYLGVTN